MSRPVVEACGCCDKGCRCHKHAPPFGGPRCGWHTGSTPPLPAFRRRTNETLEQAAEREAVANMRLREWDDPHRRAP